MQQPAPATKSKSLRSSELATLPDPNTCTTTTDGDNDWYDNILCHAARAVLLPPPADDPCPNYAADLVQQQMQALAAGNFTAVEVPWYIPTRSAKTFHPKTRGQNAYKGLIMNALGFPS